jgi:hypothetical protein
VGDAEILDCVSLFFPQWKYSAYTVGGESLKYKGLHTYSRLYAAVAVLHTYAALAASSGHAPSCLNRTADLFKKNGGKFAQAWIGALLNTYSLAFIAVFCGADICIRM